MLFMLCAAITYVWNIKLLPYVVSKTASTSRFDSRFLTAVSCSFNLKINPETDSNIVKTSEISELNSPAQPMLSNCWHFKKRAANYRLRGDLIKHNGLTVFPPFAHFGQWYFTLFRQRRNKNFTEVVAGSLSWRFRTRLLPARSLRSQITRACDLKVSLLAGYWLPRQQLLKVWSVAWVFGH